MTTTPDRYSPVRSIVLSLLIALAFALPAPASAQESGDIHEGRGSFLFQQIPLSLGWYGTAVTTICWADATGDFRPIAATYLLSAAAFYFGPMYLIWNQPISNAQTHLAVAAGYRGVPAGFALGDLVGLNLDSYGDNNYSGMLRARYGVMLATSVGAQVGGYFLARDMTLGRATLMTAYSDFGMADGLLLWGTTRSIVNDTTNVKISPFFLAGLAGGATIGYFRQRDFDCTEGQVTFIRTAGFLGNVIPFAAIYALTGLPLNSQKPLDHTTWMLPMSVAGNIAGVYLAEQIIKDKPLTVGEGLITLGCTAGGALLGSGIGVLIPGKKDPYGSTTIVEPRIVAGMGTLGAVGGLALGLRLTNAWPGSTSYVPHRGRDAWARVNVNFGVAAGAATQYATSRSFSAPQLITMEF